MAKYTYHHHWFKDFHSTVINELPNNENVVAVYAKEYYKTFSIARDITVTLSRGSKFFAYVRLRSETPNIVGEGVTKDDAVDSLIEELVSNG